MFDVCKKLFTEQGNLMLHHSKFSGERPYICDVYNKSFKVKSDQNVPQCIHTGECLHTCDVIEGAASSEDNAKIV
jgi:hypothetical protein